MRKLVMLMLVLGMVSMANAALTLVVDGVEVGDAITIAPSDTIMVGIYDDAGGAKFDVSVQIEEQAYGVDNPYGSWTMGNGVYAPPAITAAYNIYMGYYTGYGDIWYMVGTDPTTNVNSIGLLGEYEFHCDGEGSVQIDLTDSSLTAVLDSLTITQSVIPEPMTLALLGLGGLLLRRRK